MANLLYFLKALHVIGFVSWFAGLFYLVRIFVYHVEASEKTEPERSVLTQEFMQMQKRVYKIICNPAMMLTWTAGLGMLGLGLFSDLV
ncbi:MAG: CopD family protein, partial [Bacteroidota bacterium]